MNKWSAHEESSNGNQPTSRKRQVSDSPPREQESREASLSTSAKRPCQYGASCYRKNPDHWRDFSHDTDNNKKSSETSKTTPTTTRAAPTSFYGKSSGNPSSALNDHKVDKDTEDCAVGLVFSLLGVRENALDLGTSIKYAVRAAVAFLREHPTLIYLKVWLVAQDQECVEKIEEELQKHLPADDRFDAVIATDISHLKELYQLPYPLTAAVETSWRLKSNSHKVTQQLYELTGESEKIASELKSKHKTGEVGGAYELHVPQSSQLTTTHGIHHLIHIVTPNRNPLRADYIESDVQGDRLLDLSYKNMFAAFARIAGIARPAASQAVKDVKAGFTSSSASSGSKTAPGTINAFSFLMNKARNQTNTSSSEFTGPTSGSTSAPAKPNAVHKPPTSHRWMDALLPYCQHPERHPKSVISYSSDTVVIRDEYPKSRHHYLIMPRKPITDLSVLTPADLPMLNGLKETAKELVEELGLTEYKMGFHAIPSMRQLHMHVLSTDFMGTALKNKKHWNSFNTAFFKGWDEVAEILKMKGKIEFDTDEYEELLKLPLKCHICKQSFSNMPSLKKDLEQHDAMSP